MRWAGYVARMGEMNAYNILVGKLEGKRPLGRSRRRWEGKGNYGVKIWTGFIWLRIGTIKSGEFLD